MKTAFRNRKQEAGKAIPFPNPAQLFRMATRIFEHAKSICTRQKPTKQDRADLRRCINLLMCVLELPVRKTLYVRLFFDQSMF